MHDPSHMPRRPRLWFVVPVHGRLELAAICLRQLRHTCALLARDGIDASAVVVSGRDDLAALRRRLGRPFLDFAAVERDNRFLSRRFNDGIQLALDPRHNIGPADYVVPCGSDDWVDHRILTDLPGPDTVVGFQRMSFVREDGLEIMTSVLDYPGGAGIRIYPRELLEPLRFRPADEDRERACDTSILTNVRRFHGDRLRIEHRHHHDLQIVDWKTGGAQLNSYQAVARYRGKRGGDPFLLLADVYADESVDAMRAHYARARRRSLVAA